MSVEISHKGTIDFQRPLTRVVRQNISITNNNDKPVAYKVKTTAPKLYCVRPNSDVIQPGQTAEIQIMLQAFPQEPPLDVRCKDKFLILSTLIEGELTKLSLPELWTYAEFKKAGIHEHKLRCVYTPAEENAAPAQLSVAEPVVAPIVEPVQNESTVERVTTTASNEPDVAEKVKLLEEELSKYKKQVETLRESEPVIEQVQVKKSSPSYGILILFALLAAAVAYFFQINNNTQVNPYN